MIKNNLYIALLLSTFLVWTSCGTTKKIAGTSSKTSALKKGNKQALESAAFFEAEKARIKGEKKKAIDLYRAFVQVYKGNSAAYYNLANLEYLSFRFKDAESYAARSVELSPKNKYYLELYADILALNKKPKKAVEIYERLTKLHAAGADNYRYKSYRIYADLKQYDKAYNTLSRLEESWGISSEITMQKVDLLLKQKKEKQAISDVKLLIEDEPRNPVYKEKLAQLYDKLGRKEEAKKIYDQLVTDAPDDAKVLMRSSSYYLRNNDTVGFERIIKKIVANPKIDHSVRMSMLMPLIELNNDTNYIQNEILPLIRSLKQGKEDDKETVGMYADVLYGAKKYKEAAVAYREYLLLDQSKYGAWFNLMLSHSSLENLDSVVSVAKESFDYFPNNAFTHYFKGTAHYQMKDYQKSVGSLQNAIDLEPDKDLKLQIYSMMGDAYNSLKDYKKADRNFDEALKIKEDASTLNNYAYYLSVRNERLADALKMSEKSLKLMPDTKVFLDTYGWILYKQGKYEIAKGYIERAIEGDGDADVLEHLGDIHFKLNNTAKALEYWQRAKKVGGGGTELLDKKIRDGRLYE